MSEDNIVVVIDPGHGGLGGGADNGASYNGITERYINIATAKAMYEELSKYDHVKVYLTHDNPDQAMTLKQRAQFASEVGADYLISIHYNASEEHLVYGSEVWIPSIGEYYAKGYGIGKAVLSEFQDMGLYLKGVKTRVGDGNDEYYGVIRESEKLNITGLIIEHCYIDNGRDYAYYCNNDAYVRFGKADATGVAKALGLESTELGKDYTMYKDTNIAIPSSRVYQDETPPEVILKRCSSDGNGIVELTIHAWDRESQISHYAYSFDGGNTYSELFEWYDRDGDNEESIIVMNVSGNRADVVVRAYNNYNLYSSSEMVTLNGINGVYEEENISESVQSTFTAMETTSYMIEETSTFAEPATTIANSETTSIVSEQPVIETQEISSSVEETGEETTANNAETSLSEEMVVSTEAAITSVSEENSVLSNEKVWYDNRRTGAVIVVILFVVVVFIIFFKSVLATSVKKWYHSTKDIILKKWERMKNRRDG